MRYLKYSIFILSLLQYATTRGQKSWYSLNSGLNETVEALYYDLTNDLLLTGGSTKSTNNFNSTYWDGSNFNEMGGGLFGLSVYDIFKYRDTIYATGWNDLTTPTYGILAKYNPADSIWMRENKLSVGIFYAKEGVIYNQEIVLLGDYFGINGQKTIVSFNGDTTKPLLLGNTGTLGLYGGVVFNSELYIHGTFDSLQGDTTIKRIAKWNGIIWSAAATNSINDFLVTEMCVFDNKLLAGTSEGNIYQLDSNKWSLLATANGSIYSMKVFKDTLYIGGAYTQIDGKNINSICSYDGVNFTPLGDGVDGIVLKMTSDGANIYIGGTFKYSGNTRVTNIARWGLPVGINETDNVRDFTINIYPNPASNKLFISGLSSSNLEVCSYEIQNILGEVILKGTIAVQKNEGIDVSKLENGIHILRLKSLNEQIPVSIKFLKE